MYVGLHRQLRRGQLAARALRSTTSPRPTRSRGRRGRRKGFPTRGLARRGTRPPWHCQCRTRADRATIKVVRATRATRATRARATAKVARATAQVARDTRGAQAADAAEVPLVERREEERKMLLKRRSLLPSNPRSGSVRRRSGRASSAGRTRIPPGCAESSRQWT